MPKCFVMQPFDGDKFDKRFKDTFDPAIRDAGLEPYRVDQDPKVQVPIQAIEEGIREAAICFAEITTDNPNVWYELGFAFAASRPVIMVCADDRADFPFDIQHRTVIRYGTDSKSDFEDVRRKIADRLKALRDQGAMVKRVMSSEQDSRRGTLSSIETALLGILGNQTEIFGGALSFWTLKNAAEQSDLPMIQVNIGLNRLMAREFVAVSEEQDHNGEDYRVVCITDTGWTFIEENEHTFAVHDAGRAQPPDPEDFEDDIPF